MPRILENYRDVQPLTDAIHVEMGRQIRAIRMAQQKTLRWTASSLRVSGVHLSNIERGENKPSFNLIHKFHKIFGVNPYVKAWEEVTNVNPETVDDRVYRSGN